MPLTPPAAREALHKRTVACDGYIRTDGLWEVEGRIIDVKTYPFDNEWRGRVEPGMPVHEMAIRLAFDDELVIRAAEATTEFSPFAICSRAAPNFAALVGLRIGPGFMAAVRARIGKTEGCTHIVEMLQQVATTAFQTLAARSRVKPRPKAEPRAGGEQAKRKHPFLDSCYALKSDREVVKRFYPDHYVAPGAKPDA
jgi:hypothetical protein